MGMDFNKCKLFGGMRAGARIFPHPNMGCPACGHATYNTAHMLRSCKSTRHVLNAWLRHVDPSVGAGRMRLNELDFVRSIFRLQQHPHDTGPTSDGQLCVGFNTSCNTISYVSRKRQLRGHIRTSAAHEKYHLEAHYDDPKSHEYRLWMSCPLCYTLA